MKPKVLLLLAAFVLAYTLLLMLPAPLQETLDKYDISATTARLLNLTIIIPIALLWFVAFYGFVKLNNYQRIISKSKDGLQVEKLKNGILILVLSLPISTIINQILQLVAVRNPGAEAATTIIRNYISIILPLAAFLFISRGAHGLALLTHKTMSQKIMNGLVLLALLLGFTYVYLIARAPGTIDEVYHLSLAPFLFTIIIPYTFMWFLGIVSAYEIYLYSSKVKGIVYRQSWKLFSLGLVAIIVFSIFLQYLGTLSEQIQGLSLTWVLILIYILLAMWAFSYVLMALGAKKLMKIEEV